MNDTPKHTPGPWVAWYDGTFGIWNLTYPERMGYILLQAAGYSNRINLRPEDWKLIAAAPEMLEALKRILPSAIAYEMDNSDHFDEDGRIAFAEAAIAKAEGRQE